MSLFTSKTKKNPQAGTRRSRAILGSGVRRKSVTYFTRQLATMIRRGMPLLRSLELLERQQKPGAFKQIVQELAQNVSYGNPLSQGLAAYPKVLTSFTLIW